MTLDVLLLKAWTFANSPVGMMLIGSVVAWAIAKLATAKPEWMKYKGSIISAIRYAEKVIPDGSENSGLNRLDIALKYVIKVIEETEDRDVLPAEQAIIKDAISLVHNEVYPEEPAKAAGPATLAAILDAIKKTGAVMLLVVLPLLATGCFNAPEPVLKGHDQAALCVQKATADYRATIEGLAGALKIERQAHVAYALQKAMDNVRLEAAKTDGKIDAEKALKYIQEAYASRDAQIAAMDAIIAKFKQSAAAGDREAGIALELMGALRGYDAAGVDAAKTTVGALEAATDLVPGLKAGELK